MADTKIKFQLKRPFEYGSEIVTELEIREPTVKDLFELGSSKEFKDMFKFACSCANEPLVKLEKMHAKDGVELVQLVQSFLEDGQETGEI